MRGINEIDKAVEDLHLLLVTCGDRLNEHDRNRVSSILSGIRWVRDGDSMVATILIQAEEYRKSLVVEMEELFS